jgi:hypothetical protein
LDLGLGFDKTGHVYPSPFEKEIPTEFEAFPY